MLAMVLLAVLMADALEIAASNPVNQYGNQYREISAKDILAEANSSSIAYDHVTVIGDLALDNSQYNSIKIVDSSIEGNVSCKGIAFYGDVDFSNTSFHKNAIFNGTRFMAEANFNNSRFYGTATFNMSRFQEGGTFDFAYFDGLADFANVWFDNFATFYNATFMGDAQFYLSEFNGAYANFDCSRYLKYADFSGSLFNTYSTFEGAMIESGADFHATKFSNGVNFYETAFRGPATFAKSHFIEDSTFSGANFDGVSNFQNAKFDGPTYFNDTRFGGNAVFDNAQFPAPTDMTGAQFNADLMMNGTQIAKMMLEGSVFNENSRLFLARADVNKLMVSWSQIKDILSYDTSAYLSLVKNYKDLGQSSDANDCYYEYRYLNQNNKKLGYSKLLDIVAWLSCGYGVRPHYALYCGMIVILVFALILWLGRGVEGFHDIHGRQLVIASLYYSTIAFTANAKGLPLKGHYRYLGIAEGIMGWLLMALFLVTLGRLMIG